MEIALEALRISTESDVLWKRLWEGYNERSFLLEWSIQLIQRARELTLPDGLALASGLNEFAELQLTNWHTMMLDQLYQADADAQIRDEIKQSFEKYHSSTPVSRDSDKWTTQPTMIDTHGQSHPQQVQILEGVPEFSGQWPRRLSQQEELYAQAMHNLRNRPEYFVSEFSGEQSYTHMSSEEREQALFHDLLYYRDKEKIQASTQRMIEVFRVVQGFLCGLVAVLSLGVASTYL